MLPLVQKTIGFLLLTLWAQSALPQKLPFKQVAVPNPTINTLERDSLGFLWIGTNGGLFRFDGRYMDQFGPVDESGQFLPLEVDALVFGTGQQLFIGTRQGQIWSMQEDEWRAMATPKDLVEVDDLLVWRDTLWACGAHGIYYQELDSLVALPLDEELVGKAFNSMVVDERNNLCVNVLYAGVYRVSARQLYPLFPGRPRTFVLTTDEEGQFWSVGQRGVVQLGLDTFYRYQEEKKEFRNWIRCMHLDGDHIWLGADGNGLYLFNKATQSLKHYDRTNGLLAKNITALQKDQEGNLWIGTRGQGLFVLPGTALELWGFDQGMADENVISVQSIAPGILGLGTYGGEIYRFEERAGITLRQWHLPTEYFDRETDHFNGFYTDVVQQTFQLVNHSTMNPRPGTTLWKGLWTEEGVWMAVNHAVIFQPHNGPPTYFQRAHGLPSNVGYNLFMHKDTLGLAMEWGAALMKDKKMVWQYKADQMTHSTTDVVFYQNRWLFASEQSGILEKRDEELVQAPDFAAWEGLKVSDFFVDSANVLWACSPEGGIGRFDGAHFETTQPPQRTNTLGVANGTLILGTDRGVYLAPNPGDELETLRYAKADPTAAFDFICNAHTVHVDSLSSAVFLGTNKGLLQLNLTQFAWTHPVPKVYWRSTNLQNSDQDIAAFYQPAQNSFVLPAALNSLTLQLGSIYLTDPESVRYRYRLGENEPWSAPREEANIDLLKLNYGAYNLSVQAIAGNGNFSEPMEIPTIVIQKPWYLTHVAIILGVVSLALVVLFVFWYRDRAMRDRQRQLERLVNERTLEIEGQKNELLEQSRHKEFLMRELHHRVKNNLQLMSSINNIQIRSSENAQLVNILTENQKRMDSLALMHNHFYQNNILDNVQFDEYMDGLLTAILSLTSNPHVTLEKELVPIRLSPDKTIALGLIVNELISNALKHAFRGRQSGHIRIRMQTKGDEMSLFLGDNGTGLPENNAANFGLKIVHILMRQLEGELSVNGNKGTHYHIRIPLNDQHESP